jgi:hypothetical protein
MVDTYVKWNGYWMEMELHRPAGSLHGSVIVMLSTGQKSAQCMPDDALFRHRGA